MKVILLSLALLAPALPVHSAEAFFRNLLQSADHGEAEAQLILGLANKDGWDGTARPGSTAAKWRDLAAELGDPRPAFLLGLLQKEPDHMVKDLAKAMRWLSLAASQGDNYARVILGDMLLEGDGVPPDWRTGTQWIRKSANAGFAPARFRLGLIYMVGGESTPRNDIEALAWFIIAAESGSEPAREYRDERTQSLGRDAAHLAIKRSRALFLKNSTAPEEAGPAGSSQKSRHQEGNESHAPCGVITSPPGDEYLPSD